MILEIIQVNLNSISVKNKICQICFRTPYIYDRFYINQKCVFSIIITQAQPQDQYVK